MNAIQTRPKALANLLRMGHCAPAVMQTLVDVAAPEEQWLVRFSAAMPGGIGNTGFECGALTSSLELLGLRYGQRQIDGGLPVIFYKGHLLRKRFLESHKTMLCREIRGNDRFPRHCIPPVLLSPELFAEADAYDGSDSMPASLAEGYFRLYSHMRENNFHCAQAVFDQLPFSAPDRQKLLDASSAFMGGTLFMGLTCGAFAAGVMAIGLRYGEIENSYPRVIRMIYRMTTGGDAFDERINKFNRSMNTGYRLSKRFGKQCGSTQCRAITQCDFSTPEGVSKYVQGDCLARCREITEEVGERLRPMLADENSNPA